MDEIEHSSISGIHEDVTCDGCGIANFPGFRHKCLICDNYDLCHNCVHEGRVTKDHRADHPLQSLIAPYSPDSSADDASGMEIFDSHILERTIIPGSAPKNGLFAFEKNDRDGQVVEKMSKYPLYYESEPKFVFESRKPNRHQRVERIPAAHLDDLFSRMKGKSRVTKLPLRNLAEFDRLSSSTKISNKKHVHPKIEKIPLLVPFEALPISEEKQKKLNQERRLKSLFMQEIIISTLIPPQTS